MFKLLGSESPRSQLRSALTAGIAGVTFLTAMPVSAQMIEEIMVTARKREESLQTVPLAVSAFTADAIDRFGISSSEDVAKFTPGLQVDAVGGSPGDYRITLRGIPLIIGRSSVAVLVDNADITPVRLDQAIGGLGAAVNAEQLDLERIEVVKGPQSALFGRSAFAGAINYITRKPDDEFRAKVNLSAGGYGLLTAGGFVSAPIVEGKLATKASFNYSDFNGFYNNTVDGEDLGNRTAYGGTLVTRFTPTERFSADLTLIYSDTEAGAMAAYTTPDNPRVVDANLDSVEVRAGDNLNDPSRVALSTNMDYFGSKEEIFRGILNAQWEGDGFTIDSVTAYSDKQGAILFDFDYTPLNTPIVSFPPPCFVVAGCVGVWDTESDTDQFSQELRISSSGEGPLRWMAGAYYYDEKVVETLRNRFLGRHLFLGELTEDPDSAIPRDLRLDTQTWALFGSVAHDVTEQLEVEVQLRYQEDEISGIGEILSNATHLWDNAGSVPPLGTREGSIFEASNTYSSFNPRISASYQATDEVMFYGSIARGSKPGGVSLPAGLRDDLRVYSEESIWNYEIGVKSQWWDNRVLLNVTGFYTDYKDTQVDRVCFGGSGDPACLTGSPGTPVFFIENAESAEVTGLEVEFLAEPLEGLTVGLNYAYTDAKFTEYQSNRGFFLILDGAGRKMPLIPTNAITVSLSYETPINDEIDVFASAFTSYTSSRFVEPINSLSLNPRAVTDLQIGFKSDAWRITGFVDNVFDDDTIQNARSYPYLNDRTTGFLSSGTLIQLPSRRLFGVRAQYEF